MKMIKGLTMALSLAPCEAGMVSFLRGQFTEEVAAEVAVEPLGHFLRSMNTSASGKMQLSNDLASRLDGVSHYRLLPGFFHEEVKYHFDGLATVMRFDVSNGEVTFTSRAFESAQFKDWDSCLVVQSGSFKLGTEACLTNPGVNLLPIEGQLWLTIDTAAWGRMDPDTLETSPAKAKTGLVSVLNAHPACEADGGACFVQYGCDQTGIPYTDQVCFSQLQPGETDMTVTEISRATLPKKKLIQHSHEPCLTQNYLVSKLDAFGIRNPLLNKNSGLLKATHQVEDDLWLVMDRRTNTSRVMSSNLAFVNNHFSNCVELPSGEVQIDIAAATENYLDTYFPQKLQKPHAEWNKIFHEPIRCLIPESGDSIQCESFFPEGSTGPIFDYPVFNPKYKQDPDYKFLYAIAAESSKSRWFDQLVKLDVKDRTVVSAWSAPGVFLTEADFIPRGEAGEPASEDDGVLVSILYNSTQDDSSLAFFDAKTLNMLEQHSLGFVAPFHAHGIICEAGRPCYTNP